MSALLPDTFLFGAATSSYQIEGHDDADGAEPSIWSSFSQRDFPGQTIAPADFACSHYTKWKEDIRLMKELGFQSYRFSVSWPRILPNGEGQPNEKGLAFYEQLIDELLANGIKPMLTSYHWDLPQVLQDKGGWSNPDSITWFSNFTRVLAERFAGKISFWVTFNEPWVFLHKGLISGDHAPGYKDIAHAAAAYKHILLAHGSAVKIVRSVRPDIPIGPAVNLGPFYPLTDTEPDRQACKRMDDYLNRLFLDPWMKGKIPDITAEAFGEHLPEFSAEELAEIKQPVDFVGINYYTRHTIYHDEQAFIQAETRIPDSNKTEMDWEVYPEGLYEILKWVNDTYGGPDMYITENGAAYNDKVENGVVDDKARVDYLREHLKQSVRAVEDGIPLRGYYAWSFMDNYEWEHGYNQRFGIVHVDFDTKKRTVKNSGLLYKDIIARHKNRKPLFNETERV